QLAELWWEKARYVSLQEVRDYDERYGAWLANREKDAQSAGAEPKVSTEKSDGYRRKALASYQDILQRYPEYARKDELLFVLAYNQYEIGEQAAALRSYQALIDQFPASRFVPDAYVQMGEHYFQHDDLARGRAAVEAAGGYFGRKAGGASSELVDRLAATYFESGKFDYAIRVYRLLQEKAPDDARAAAWQQRVLLAYDKLNRRDAVAQEMERLVSGYGPRSEWAKAKAARGASLDEANQLAESALRELVQDYHQEAIKTTNAATYRLARDIYRRYLDSFPESESAYNLRFYYAEILYALEEWHAAADQYARVAEADAKGEFAQRAANDAILALEKAMAVAQGRLGTGELADAARVDEQRPKGTVEQGSPGEQSARDDREEPIPELDGQLVTACERYSRLAPDAQDQPAIHYKAAFILYRHRHYAEAGTRFAEIVRRWPSSPIAQKAADLSLDMLNSKQEWLALSDL